MTDDHKKPFVTVNHSPRAICTVLLDPRDPLLHSERTQGFAADPDYWKGEVLAYVGLPHNLKDLKVPGQLFDRRPQEALRYGKEREFFIGNLLVRVHRCFWCTGLAPWEFESPFPGSLISTFLFDRRPQEALRYGKPHLKARGFKSQIAFFTTQTAQNTTSKALAW